MINATKFIARRIGELAALLCALFAYVEFVIVPARGNISGAHQGPLTDVLVNTGHYFYWLIATMVVLLIYGHARPGRESQASSNLSANLPAPKR